MFQGKKTGAKNFCLGFQSFAVSSLLSHHRLRQTFTPALNKSWLFLCVLLCDTTWDRRAFAFRRLHSSTHPVIWIPLLDWVSCRQSTVSRFECKRRRSERGLNRRRWMPEDSFTFYLTFVLLLIRHFVKLFLVILLAFISATLLSYLLIDPRVWDAERHESKPSGLQQTLLPSAEHHKKKTIKIRCGGNVCFNYPQIANKVKRSQLRPAL